MEPKKNSLWWIFGGMVVFGVIIETIRITLFKGFTTLPEQMVLCVTNQRMLWNALHNVRWYIDFGLLANGVAAGIGAVLAVSLFTGTKETAPGSGLRAMIGTVVGCLMAVSILPGATLVQVTVLIAVIGTSFGIALGADLISSVELFQTFGIGLGMTIVTFFLYGGVVALAVMLTLIVVNIVGIFFGFLIGCTAVWASKRIIQKKA